MLVRVLVLILIVIVIASVFGFVFNILFKIGIFLLIAAGVIYLVKKMLNN
ncbi:MAG: hypothetical protein HRT61_06755 [Ekhidna sp.]|nr:hypothetical protein [Ekhidna sp.]